MLRFALLVLLLAGALLPIAACAQKKVAQSGNGSSQRVVWKAGTSNWKPSTSGQCGTPVLAGTTFTFALAIDGTNCIRNQVDPLDPDGSTLLLTNGRVYTWTWHETDGPPPGMGPDADARSLVWQIHGYIERDSPCTGLTFINGPDQVSKPQLWGFSTCAGLVWSGAYTPGESDDWKVVALISSSSDGWTELWRNGRLQGHWKGANFHNSATNQAWFNFGPYKYRWSLAAAGGSSMSSVAQTISGMALTVAP